MTVPGSMPDIHIGEVLYERTDVYHKAKSSVKQKALDGRHQY